MFHEAPDGAFVLHRSQLNQRIDHAAFAGQHFDQHSRFVLGRLQDVRMPHRQKAALQPGVRLNPCRDLREARLHPAADQPEDRRQSNQIADVVCEIHRPAPVIRLAG
jgi:hypothetical protein